MIRNVMTTNGKDSHLTAGRKAVIEIMIKQGMTQAKSGRQEYTVEINPTGQTTHRARILINERRTIGDDVRLYADDFIFDHYPQTDPTPTQPAEYPMIEGEGAPQYTFALPDEPTQLALL